MIQNFSGGIQKITENEVIIYKPRWGAFYSTSLHEYLQKLKIDTLVFSGCNFPNCPRISIYEASERDYRIVLAEMLFQDYTHKEERKWKILECSLIQPKI